MEPSQGLQMDIIYEAIDLKFGIVEDNRNLKTIAKRLGG
jgi:hypothetical protein